MANFQALKTAIEAVIKENGSNEITGDVLQDALISIVNALGNGGNLVSFAKPDTNPESSDSNLIYLASTPGVYVNFGAHEVKKNTIAAFTNKSGSWGLLSETDITPYLDGFEEIRGAFNVSELSSSNKLDPNDFTLLSLLNESNGTLITSGGVTPQYDTSGFTPCMPGVLETLLNIKDPLFIRKVCFYNAQKAFVSGIDGSVTETKTITPPAGSSFYRISVVNKNYTQRPNVSEPRFYGTFVGSNPIWEPFISGESLTLNDSRPSSEKPDKAIATIENTKQVVDEALEEANMITAEEVQSMISADTKALKETFSISTKVSTNLLDPSKFSLESLLDDNKGTLLTGSGTTQQYDTTDFVPVTPELYTIMNVKGPRYARKICYYDSNKVFIIGFDTVVTTSNTFTPIEAYKFVRFSVPNMKFVSQPNVNEAKFYGLFKGANPVWQPFDLGGKTVEILNPQPTSSKTDNSVATIMDIKQIASVTPDVSDLVSYSLSGKTLKVSFGDAYISGEVGNSRGYNGNNMFNFTEYNMFDSTRNISDDVAPMHIQGTTLGANHGQPTQVATVAAHGLTNASIGRSWTKDANTYYLMRIVDANTLVFLSQNKGTASAPQFVALTAGSLIGTTNLNVTSVSGGQLYPSIKNLTQRILKDGIDPITADKTGTAAFIDVVEGYDIMNINDVLNNIIARAGSMADPVFDGSSVVRVENVYRFLPNNAVAILVNIRLIQSVSFADIMANQAILIGVNGATQYYIPNSLPVGAGDFRRPLAVNWSSSVPSTFTVVSTQQDPLNPPNRIIQYHNNMGFMLGYIKNRGVGKALQNYTDRTFEIRSNTGKIYPHPIEGTKVGSPIPANSIYNIAMVRSYTDLRSTRVGNRLSCFTFNLDGGQYVYLDYSGTMVDNVILNRPALNGKLISVLESKNTVLNTDTYNGGFYVTATYVANETCFIVLFIK